MVAEDADGGGIAWGWVVGLLVVVGAVMGVTSCLEHIEDVMINGSPTFTDDELRDRPMLDEVMPTYVGAAEAVRTALVRAGATADEGATQYADAARWAAAELPATFDDEPVYRHEQVVDGHAVRLWETGRVGLGLVLPADADRARLRRDLAAAVRGYGFTVGRAWSPSEWELFSAGDSWGATITVDVRQDGRLDVGVRSGLHLCIGAPSVPPAGRPPPTSVGPKAA